MKMVFDFIYIFCLAKCCILDEGIRIMHGRESTLFGLSFGLLQQQYYVEGTEYLVYTGQTKSARRFECWHGDKIWVAIEHSSHGCFS